MNQENEQIKFAAQASAACDRAIGAQDARAFFLELKMLNDGFDALTQSQCSKLFIRMNDISSENFLFKDKNERELFGRLHEKLSSEQRKRRDVLKRFPKPPVVDDGRRQGMAIVEMKKIEAAYLRSQGQSSTPSGNSSRPSEPPPSFFNVSESAQEIVNSPENKAAAMRVVEQALRARNSLEFAVLAKELLYYFSILNFGQKADLAQKYFSEIRPNTFVGTTADVAATTDLGEALLRYERTSPRREVPRQVAPRNPEPEKPKQKGFWEGIKNIFSGAKND